MMTPNTWLHEAGDTHGCDIDVAHIPRTRSYSTASTASTADTRDKKAACRLCYYGSRSETHGRRSFSICTTRNDETHAKQGSSAVGRYLGIDWGSKKSKALPAPTRKQKSGSDDALDRRAVKKLLQEKVGSDV